jgi:hypothetical protein
MEKIHLEIDQIVIHRHRLMWKLYFIVMIEHPTDADKMVISVMPEYPILVAPEQDNTVMFREANENGGDGLFVLSREMPANKELNVHIYVRHSRRRLHNIATILSDIETGIGGQGFGLLTNILGTTNPWLAIAKSAIPLVGQILGTIPDRDMGFVTMFERFGSEFDNQAKLARERTGGHVTITSSWSVKNL